MSAIATVRAEEAEVLAPAYDLDRVRADFPILSREVHGHPLVYLDNAASTQKPRQVVLRREQGGGGDQCLLGRGMQGAFPR